MATGTNTGDGDGGGGGGGGNNTGRMPTWRERENNKRRERRRRAIAAKIFAGLRAHGGYRLPKHCDNNEVLKALCTEAGWTVETDGTTYRKGCRPAERTEPIGGSISPSPCSSYQQSPRASYDPSPASSSFPSRASSPFVTHSNSQNNGTDSDFIPPWLKKLSHSAASNKFPQLRPLFIHNGSISAPVTPPLSSPTARTPRMNMVWNDSNPQALWNGANGAFMANSTPPSPGQSMVPDSAWLAGIQISSTGLSSPTYSLVGSNPFGLFKEVMMGGGTSRMCTPGQSGTCSPTMSGIPGGSSSRMCTPGQSGTCSPIVGGIPRYEDAQMPDRVSEEFAFGTSSNGSSGMVGMVRAWEGETIHEECIPDELELTLGSSRTRADAS